MRTFCGKLSKKTLDSVTSIEAECDTIPTPAIALLLDLFPSLQRIPQWVPGGGYKRECKRYTDLCQRLWNELREEVKLQVVSQVTASGHRRARSHGGCPHRPPRRRRRQSGAI